MLVTQDQVRARIKLLTDSSAEPVLTDPADIDTLVEMASRVDLYGNIPNNFSEWESNFVYQLGEQVVSVARAGDAFIPIVRNGYYFTCTTAGTSGAAEPAWATVVGQQTVDGTVHWTCSGPAPWNPTYDVNYAIAQGWLLKSVRLAGNYNFMANGKMFSREQFYHHCVQMSKRFSAKSGIKGIRLGPHDPLFLDAGAGGVTTNAD